MELDTCGPAEQWASGAVKYTRTHTHTGHVVKMELVAHKTGYCFAAHTSFALKMPHVAEDVHQHLGRLVSHIRVSGIKPLLHLQSSFLLMFLGR